MFDFGVRLDSKDYSDSGFQVQWYKNGKILISSITNQGIEGEQLDHAYKRSAESMMATFEIAKKRGCKSVIFKMDDTVTDLGVKLGVGNHDIIEYIKSLNLNILMIVKDSGQAFTVKAISRGFADVYYGKDKEKILKWIEDNK